MNASLYILFLGATAGLFFIKRKKGRPFALLTILLLITSAVEIWVTVLGHHTGVILVYNLFSLVEITLWAFIFLHLNEANRKYFLAATALLLAASLLEIIFHKGFHTYTYRLFSLFAIFNCGLYLYKLATARGIISIARNGAFWIVAGVIIFQTVFFFYLTALDFSAFRHDNQALQAFRQIIAVTNICYYCLLLTGLLCSIFYRQ